MYIYPCHFRHVVYSRAGRWVIFSADKPLGQTLGLWRITTVLLGATGARSHFTIIPTKTRSVSMPVWHVCMSNMYVSLPVRMSMCMLVCMYVRITSSSCEGDESHQGRLERRKTEQERDTQMTRPYRLLLRFVIFSWEVSRCSGSIQSRCNMKPWGKTLSMHNRNMHTCI